MSRFISVELDFEVDEYIVFVLIDVEKYEGLMEFEEVLCVNVKNCCDKIFWIGLLYDLVFSKVKIVEIEEEKIVCEVFKKC